MATELELYSSNIHILLIIAIIVCISLYFFIEIKKIKHKISQIEDFINFPKTDNAQKKTSFFDKLVNPLQNNLKFPPKTTDIPP